MDQRTKEFYVNKFKTISEQVDKTDTDRTIQIVALSTIESILTNPEIFEKFLDFENNLSFFKVNRIESLGDYVADIKAYSEYMIENMAQISPDVRERMSFFTDKTPDRLNENEALSREMLSDSAFAIIGNIDRVKELLNKADNEMVNGFTVGEIKNFLIHSQTLKELMSKQILDDTVQKNYQYFQDVNNLIESQNKAGVIKIDGDLEQLIVSRINNNNPSVDEICNAINECIASFDYDSGLVNYWKELAFYFLNKYGIKAYFKEDNEDAVVFFDENYRREITKPQELDETYRENSFRNEYETVVSTSYQLSDEMQMEPELEELIMSQVKLTGNPKIDLFNIYNSLNRALLYSSSMIALNQDKSSEIVNSVYNKNISEYSKENRSVTCRNWSEMFAYLSKKYVGCDAFINKDGFHKKVSIILDKNIIFADATNAIISPLDGTKMTDLTRAKLGLLPAGFTSLFLIPEVENLKREFKVFNEDELSLECDDYAEQEDVSEFMSLVENENLQDRVLGLEGLGLEEKLLRKLSYVNELLGLSEIEALDVLGYLPPVLRTVLTQEEASKVKLHNKLYTDFDENLECDLLPVISIDVSQDNVDEKYFYLIYSKEKGLRRITKQQILEKIQSGEFKVIKKGKNISGIKDFEIEAQTEQHIEGDMATNESFLDEQEGEGK